MSLTEIDQQSRELTWPIEILDHRTEHLHELRYLKRQVFAEQRTRLGRDLEQARVELAGETPADRDAVVALANERDFRGGQRIRRGVGRKVAGDAVVDEL